LSAAFLAASLAGQTDDSAAEIGAALPPDWPGGSPPILEIRLAGLAADPYARPWLLRAMIVRTPERRLVGHVAYHGPPDSDRTVEVGYTVKPAYRRRGYASEAVAALLRWAVTEHAVVRRRASVSPGNLASLGVIGKLEFVHTGVQWDDIDGKELVFHLDLRDPPGPD